MTTKILVVDDNQDNLDLMIYLLGKFGHTTLTAVDGKQALDVAKKEKPDLIICDIQLPKLDGIAVVKAIKSDPELHTTPMIAVTAYAMVGDKDKIIAAGFDSYIDKPINPEKFISQIEFFLKTIPQKDNSVK